MEKVLYLTQTSRKTPYNIKYLVIFATKFGLLRANERQAESNNGQAKSNERLQLTQP